MQLVSETGYTYLIISVFVFIGARVKDRLWPFFDNFFSSCPFLHKSFKTGLYRFLFAIYRKSYVNFFWFPLEYWYWWKSYSRRQRSFWDSRVAVATNGRRIYWGACAPPPFTNSIFVDMICLVCKLQTKIMKIPIFGDTTSLLRKSEYFRSISQRFAILQINM